MDGRRGVLEWRSERCWGWQAWRLATRRVRVRGGAAVTALIEASLRSARSRVAVETQPPVVSPSADSAADSLKAGDVVVRACSVRLVRSAVSVWNR